MPAGSKVILLAAAIASLGPHGVTQTAWVVDAYGGAGAHFTDFPPAVAAAATGDTLIVRRGVYTAPVIDKGLRVAPATWDTAILIEGDFIVRGLAAGETCVLKRLNAAYPFDNNFVCEDNEGAVVMEDVSLSLGDQYFRIKRCRDVTMKLCAGNFMEIEDSTVLIVDSRFLAPPTGTPLPRPWAMSATRSKVILANSDVVGSTGAIEPVTCIVQRQPGPALQIESSDVLISGDSRLIGNGAGTVFCGTRAQAAAAFGSGTIAYDTLGPSPLTGPVRGSIHLAHHAAPTLCAQVSWPGGNLDLSLVGPADAAEAILVSLPRATPLFFGPGAGWPGWWIDETNYAVLQVGTLSALGTVSLQYPLTQIIPPTLYNTPAAFQAGVLTRSGPLMLSTAAVAVLGPS
ncbi:MAG: hypothetical protein AAF628_15710 [Planctomycetota bacterium]